MKVAVNACADAYDEKALPQGTPTLWLTEKVVVLRPWLHS
jgi:hypothetical protein